MTTMHKRWGATILLLMSILGLVACGPSGEVTQKELVMGQGAVAAYNGLRHSAWISSLIIRGKVIEKLPAEDGHLSNTLNTDTGPVEIETPYVITPWTVEVEEVLRGTPHDRIRVEQSGGRTAKQVYFPEESWPIDEGREFIFFLLPKTNAVEPNTYRIWEVWEIDGNQVLPKNGMDPTMTYGALKNRIAEELRKPIPTDATQPMIPLEQSPPGPGL